MNRKAATLFLLCLASGTIDLSVRCFAQERSTADAQDGSAEYKLFQAITSNAVQAFGCLEKCDADIAKLVAVSPNKVSSSFVAAKLAWVEGRPTEAIRLLENIIQSNGESTDPTFGVPVSVLAGFWIGTISRHCGDVRYAGKAYTDIGERVDKDAGLKALVVICYLYQAEIESEVLGQKNAALDWLKKIKEVKPPGNQGNGYAIYQEWADYQIVALTDGVQKARLSLKGSSAKTSQCILLVMQQLGLNGVCGEPQVGFYNDERQVILQKALDMAVECRTSRIDRSLSQLLLGRISEEGGKTARAEKHYGYLFASEAYFAPEGGVNLARLQKKQGKIDESKKTLAEIKERFPGYSKLVDELSRK